MIQWCRSFPVYFWLRMTFLRFQLKCWHRMTFLAFRWSVAWYMTFLNSSAFPRNWFESAHNSNSISETQTTIGWGGAYNAPPPANFLNNSKKRADIDAKLTVPYSAPIWHPQTKFQRNPPRNFWEKGVLVKLCLAILGRKMANIQMLLECRILK